MLFCLTQETSNHKVPSYVFKHSVFHNRRSTLESYFDDLNYEEGGGGGVCRSLESERAAIAGQPQETLGLQR